MHRIIRSAPILIAAVALFGCDSSPSAVDTLVRPATLSFYGNLDVISLPDTAVVGVPFTASVRSYGGGCVSKDETRIELSGQSASIRPFVREPAENAHVACPDILYFFAHDLELVFNQPGQATVRVFGIREPERTSYTVTRTLPVVPPRPMPL